MARLIRIEATGPVKIDPSAGPRDEHGNLKPLFICACGLSRTLPMCDGSHKQARASEQPGKLYVYDDDRCTIREVRDDRAASAG